MHPGDCARSASPREGIPLLFPAICVPSPAEWRGDLRPVPGSGWHSRGAYSDLGISAIIPSVGLFRVVFVERLKR
jgi:hypothetical protein